MDHSQATLLLPLHQPGHLLPQVLQSYRGTAKYLLESLITDNTLIRIELVCPSMGMHNSEGVLGVCEVVAPHQPCQPGVQLVQQG